MNDNSRYKEDRRTGGDREREKIDIEREKERERERERERDKKIGRACKRNNSKRN